MAIEFQQHPEGIVLSLRVAPGSAGDRVMGEYAGRLKVAVSAAPEKGKANKAVIELVARVLGVPKKNLSIIAGETSPDKKLLIKGMELAEVLRRLEEITAGESKS
jgi:hypothetical protein